MEGRATQMPLRELLLHLLEYTSTDVIDELWPDNATTLDDIAGQILRRDAHELAEEIRAKAEKVRAEDWGRSNRSKRPWLMGMEAARKVIDPEKQS